MGEINNMKKQLALAVRSIQWSYAIFWSDSSSQPGVLSWGEGYYNGDIKTRKTSQGVEVSSDQIGLHRSEQLRDLFKSLKTVETNNNNINNNINPQTKRPSAAAAALSPEDLTDAEWYYLVCMSFVFNIGQGLPGRALANGQPIWLNNANSTDCKIFSRSLLAKSASIQTVVCFPFMEGVIELGTTDMVSEDLSLIQQIKTSFLNDLYLNVPNKNSGATLKPRKEEEDLACVSLDPHNHDNNNAYKVGYDVINTTSPNGSSNTLQANKSPEEEAFLVERWQVMDDEFSNCVHNSMNSSDCISQTLASPEKITPAHKLDNSNNNNNNNPTDDPCAYDLQNCNNTKMTLVDPRSDEWHYQQVLSALLKGSEKLIMGVHFQNFHDGSSFVNWKNRGPMDFQWPRVGTSQNLLKKVLFEVPRMHLDGVLESQEEENDYKEGMRVEADEIGMNHVLSERRRRAKLNERFLTLRSLVPSISKDDKVSILDDAIEYLRKLEKRIKELEAHKELTDTENGTKRSPQDMVERTSDHNFSRANNNNAKKVMVKKRKACDIDETGRENNSDAQKGSSTDVIVRTNENEVVIEMKCPSRSGRMMEIMEAVNSLNLDFNSVQSAETDGNLYLTIKSKLKGPSVVTARRIKQTLQKVASKG